VLYSGIIKSLGDTPQATMAGEIGRLAASALELSAQCGDHNADHILSWMARNGLARDVAAYLKQTETVVEFRNGEIRQRRQPARYGLRITEDDKLVITKGSQLLLWWEMRWPQFNRMVRDLRKQQQTLTERVEVFTRVILPLQARYPKTKTVAEACSRAGVDPQHLIFDQHEQISA